jgi:hypothetical protein
MKLISVGGPEKKVPGLKIAIGPGNKKKL